jgi:hypothetical protein
LQNPPGKDYPFSETSAFLAFLSGVINCNPKSMKRKLAAAILGIAASVELVSSAHAQGFVVFGNYDSNAPVFYGDTSHPLNNAFTAGLWYFLGTTTLATGNGVDAFPAGWETASVTQQFNVGSLAGPAGAGFFSGVGANSVATIPDYVSGPITFAVTAYEGTSYGLSEIRGHSASFTLPSIATGSSPVGEFGSGLQSFIIPVPEPSIFALSGLGAAALTVIRRRK